MGSFPFQDMRTFLTALEGAGELVRVKKEVDWDLEAAAIVRRCCETGAPAPLFENIKGYPEGFNKLVGAQMAGSKKGMIRRPTIALGLEPDAPVGDVIEEALFRMNNPIKPTIVNTGPCKENIILGKDVDVLKFPAPMIHKGDGGRFICTWHLTITKDLDTDWVNWGLYRNHVLTRQRLAIMVNAWRHIGMHFYQGYEPRGVTMPIAIAVGPDPLCCMSSSVDIPALTNEVDIAGGLRKEPVELVKCETNDLYVPATAEVVFEGHIVPGERCEEGPHGEFTGYRVSERSSVERLFIRLDAITHRNNPIYPFSNMGMPIDDGHAMQCISLSAALLQEIRGKGIKSVKGLFVPPWGIFGGVVISLKKPYNQIIHEIASIVWGSNAGRQFRYVVFIEDTADPYNPQEVLHEIFYKCHPIRGIQTMRGGPGSPLDPASGPRDRQFMIGAAAIIDCTAPYEWEFPPIESRFTNPIMYPKDLQDKVLKNWKEYGF